DVCSSDPHPEDLEALNKVSLGYSVHHFLALLHKTKDRVLVVQPWGGPMGDEKLAAVGPGTCIGHGQYARPRMPELRVELVVKFISWISRSASQRATSLYHKIGYDPVELQAIVIGLALGPCRIFHVPFGQGNEIAHRARGLVMGKPYQYFPLGGVEFCVDTVLHIFNLVYYTYSLSGNLRACKDKGFIGQTPGPWDILTHGDPFGTAMGTHYVGSEGISGK